MNKIALYFLPLVLLPTSLLPARTAPVSRAAGEEDPWPAAQKLICFPPHLFPSVREVRGEGYVLYAAAADLDETAARQHLDAVVHYLRELPLYPAPTSEPATATATRPVVAALYRTQEQFRDLWHRVGVYYGGRVVGARHAGGYSYRVFCASYVEPGEPAACPPELCHELAHVWLWQHAGLPNDGNWLSEGLATAVQERFFPDPPARAEQARRVRTGRYVPLKRLMETQPLEPASYWQAAALARTLLASHPHALPAVVEALREGTSAHAIVTKVLGTDWPSLEQQWKATVLDEPGR